MLCIIAPAYNYGQKQDVLAIDERGVSELRGIGEGYPRLMFEICDMQGLPTATLEHVTQDEFEALTQRHARDRELEP